MSHETTVPVFQLQCQYLIHVYTARNSSLLSEVRLGYPLSSVFNTKPKSIKHFETAVKMKCSESANSHDKSTWDMRQCMRGAHGYVSMIELSEKRRRRCDSTLLLKMPGKLHSVESALPWLLQNSCVSGDDGIVWKSESGLLQSTLERDKQASFQNLGSSRRLLNVDSSLSCGQKLMENPHPDFMKFGGNLITGPGRALDCWCV